MNPPTFNDTKVYEDPKVFIDEVLKVLDAIRVTFREKVELGTYQLRDVAQVQFVQWRDERLIRAGPVDWGVFKVTFLKRFFP